jgi:hypothetical protein
MGNGTQARPEDRARAREARRRELDKLPKVRLAALYRTRGYLGSAHPLSAWTKAEIISSLLDGEFPVATS